MPICIHKVENPFSSTNFQLQKDDTIFLFSDGHMDQFGFEKEEKYKKYRFVELLKQIQSLPFDVQKSKPVENFET